MHSNGLRKVACYVCLYDNEEEIRIICINNQLKPFSFNNPMAVSYAIQLLKLRFRI